MARGRKKKLGLDVKQKMKGSFLVQIIDEENDKVYLPGVTWKYIEELYNKPKVKITKIEEISLPYYRPKDITEESFKKLAGGTNG